MVWFGILNFSLAAFLGISLLIYNIKKGLDPDGSYRHYVKLNGHGEGHTRNCLMLSYNLPDWRKTLEGLHLE